MATQFNINKIKEVHMEPSDEITLQDVLNYCHRRRLEALDSSNREWDKGKFEVARILTTRANLYNEFIRIISTGRFPE